MVSLQKRKKRKVNYLAWVTSATHWNESPYRSLSPHDSGHFPAPHGALLEHKTVMAAGGTSGRNSQVPRWEMWRQGRRGERLAVEVPPCPRKDTGVGRKEPSSAASQLSGGGKCFDFSLKQGKYQLPCNEN